MATATPATDHDEIRRWAEKRGGRPARVSATGGGNDPGILRIDFPGYSGEETLEEISWDEWLDWFDRNRLAILLGEDRFNKLVSRSTARAAKKRAPAKKKAPAKKAASKKAAAKKRPAAKRRPAAKKAASKKSPAKKRSSSKKTARRRR